MTTTSARTDTTRELVTRLYAAAAAGDLATLGALLSPDLVVIEPDFLPYGGTYTGLDAFTGLFAQVSAVLDLTALVLDGLAVEDDLAYGRVRVPLRSGGEATIVEEWRVRDRRVVAARVFWLNSGSDTGIDRPA